MRRLRRFITPSIIIILIWTLLVMEASVSHETPAAITVRPPNLHLSNSVENATSECIVSSTNQTEIGQQASSSANVTVPGNVLSAVRNKTIQSIGLMPPASILHLEIVFKIRNEEQFSKCAAAISNPSSPEYSHFLNATTLAPFVETPNQKALITNFLEANGLNVTDGASPLVLNIIGPTSLVQKVFHLHIGLYRGKHLFYSTDADPTLPQNLAEGVEDIEGLENYTTVKPAETPCSGPYCAQAVEVGYDMQPLYAEGINGAGVTVAVVDGPGDPNPTAALHTYDTQYGLPNPVLQVLCGGGTTWGPCRNVAYAPTWGSEAAMDIEAVHAIAPGAEIRLFYPCFENCSASTTEPFIDAIDYIAGHNLAQVVSNSWEYECSYGPCSDGQLQQETYYFFADVRYRLEMDTAQGLTILFATGDQGAKPDGVNLGPEYPSSDPSVLAVGATDLSLAGCGAKSCIGYSSEDGASISGGGYSGVFGVPDWQTNVPCAPNYQCFRDTPDVSMFGYSPNFWVYSTKSDKCLTSSVGSGWFGCAGTSLSTPLWAGFLAVALQLRGLHEFGEINQLIYLLAESAKGGQYIRDITSGSNNGYSAGPGWDYVTGWGSPIGFNLASALAINVTTARQMTLKQGASGSTEVSVTFGLDESGTATLECASLPPGTTCSFDPTSGSGNFNSILTVNATNWAPRGTFDIEVIASAPTIRGITTFTLTVDQHPPGNCAVTSVNGVYNCPLTFVTGWNLISLPVVPLANGTFTNSVASIFGSSPSQGWLSNVTAVYTYASGKWTYCFVTKQVSGSHDCVGTLTSMVDGRGYWVYANDSFSLNYATNLFPSWGGLVGSTIPPASPPPAYPLAAGWNLIGYKPQPNVTLNENVSTYLRNVNGDYNPSNVWIYDNSNQTWIRATPGTVLEPSQAMWIFMTKPATLIS